MTPEDAYFHMILLQTGHTDIYDSHLNTYLQKEDPLSDIVLSLSFCDTLDKTIGCLYDYTIDKKTRVIFVGKIPDHTDDIHSSKDIPSWKRMCYCILKNDHICRSMGFGLSKEEKRKVEMIRAKYGGIGNGK